MKRLLLWVILVAVISSLTGAVLAQGLGIRNATVIFRNQRKIYGAQGNITFKAPNLNGEASTYARIILYSSPPYTIPERFLELGWVKGLPRIWSTIC
jgi:hypothetical protein